MLMNAPRALCALIAGEIIVHETIKYILSEDNKLCKIVKENGLNVMQDTGMTLENFIKMCRSIPSKSLTDSIKKNSRLTY